MALPFSIWREEIEAELAQAQQEITDATVAIHAAELAYDAVKAQHEAMRNAILPLRQPLASALAARVRHSEESVHAAGRDMVCARGAVTGLRDRRADIEEALRQIEQLLATPAAVDDDLKYGARASTRGRLRIRAKSGHRAADTVKRARLVISPTMVRLAWPAILA